MWEINGSSYVLRAIAFSQLKPTKLLQIRLVCLYVNKNEFGFHNYGLYLCDFFLDVQLGSPMKKLLFAY